MTHNEQIFTYLDDLFPNPKCELNYNKPYELVIAVMLSAQTTDKRVNKVTKKLFNKYNTLEKLATANIKDIENIVRELGNYTKKSKAVIDISQILLQKHNQTVPTKRKELESLPMVGRKTTNVILSEIYNIPNIAVDTHVERTSKRLKLAKKEDDVLKVEQKLKRKVKRENWSKFHHQMVLFGRYYCKAKNPKCSTCQLSQICSYNKTNSK